MKLRDLLNTTALERDSLYREQLARYMKVRGLLQLLRFRRVAAQKRLEYLNANLPVAAEIEAWCADYTEELTGAVGTIEPGRVDAPPIIVPAGSDGTGAAYDAARDGQLRPVCSQTPAQALLNTILLPGVAKWRPRYRLGQITALDGDSADVDLDPLTSTRQALNVNRVETLTGIPVVYLDCHGAAFEVGDRVVILYDGNGANPTVVGFEDHPRVCYRRGLIVRHAAEQIPLIHAAGAWSASKPRAPWVSGNLDWQGAAGDILSWRGLPSRYFPWHGAQYINSIDALHPGLIYLHGDAPGSAPVIITQVHQPLPEGQTLWDVLLDNTIDDYCARELLWSDPGLYYKGKRLFAPDASRIAGAAINRGATVRVIYIISSGQGYAEQVWVADLSGTSASNHRQIGSLAWTYCGDAYNLPEANNTAWLFNASGTEATTLRFVGDRLHRIRLSVNWQAETVSTQDLGAGAQSEWTKNTSDPGGDYPFGSYTQSLDSTLFIEFGDYIGDIETVGRLEHAITIDYDRTEEEKPFPYTSEGLTPVTCSALIETKTTTTVARFKIDDQIQATKTSTATRSSELYVNIYSDYMGGFEDIDNSASDLRLTLIDLRAATWAARTGESTEVHHYEVWSGNTTTDRTNSSIRDSNTGAWGWEIHPPNDSASHPGDDLHEEFIPESRSQETGYIGSPVNDGPGNAPLIVPIMLQPLPILGQLAWDGNDTAVATPQPDGALYLHLTGGDLPTATGHPTETEFWPLGVW